MKLDQFLKRNNPNSKRSNKFDSYKSEIEELLKNSYSQNQIIDFLRGNGLKCTQGELNKYLKKGEKKNEVQKVTPTLPQIRQEQIRQEQKKIQENSTTKTLQIPRGYQVGIPFKEGDQWYKYLQDGTKTKCLSTGVSHNPDPRDAKDLY